MPANASTSFIASNDGRTPISPTTGRHLYGFGKSSGSTPTRISPPQLPEAKLAKKRRRAALLTRPSVKIEDGRFPLQGCQLYVADVIVTLDQVAATPHFRFHEEDGKKDVHLVLCTKQYGQLTVALSGIEGMAMALTTHPVAGMELTLQTRYLPFKKSLLHAQKDLDVNANAYQRFQEHCMANGKTDAEPGVLTMTFNPVSSQKVFEFANMVASMDCPRPTPLPLDPKRLRNNIKTLEWINSAPALEPDSHIASDAEDADCFSSDDSSSSDEFDDVIHGRNETMYTTVGFKASRNCCVAKEKMRQQSASPSNGTGKGKLRQMYCHGTSEMWKTTVAASAPDAMTMMYDTAATYFSDEHTATANYLDALIDLEGKAEVRRVETARTDANQHQRNFISANHRKTAALREAGLRVIDSILAFRKEDGTCPAEFFVSDLAL